VLLAQRTVRLILIRWQGADFSDLDVAVLTLLRPHLQAAFAAAECRRCGPSPLTAREREILRYVAAGYTNGLSPAGSRCPVPPYADTLRIPSPGSG
jgi:ATP/maltotriose-dependent transcriptional regulator MalT